MHSDFDICVNAGQFQIIQGSRHWAQHRPVAEIAQLIPNVLNITEMFDKTFHIRLDNMTQIKIGGTWHPVTDVSHVALDV